MPNPFEDINQGMTAFIGFVLVALLVILLVNVVMETDIVCDDSFFDGSCIQCSHTDFSVNNKTHCCNNTGTTDACTGVNRTAAIPTDSAAYNATLNLQEAAILAPQFSQLIVIIIIVAGIVLMLGAIAYGAYQKMKS